MMNFYIHYGTAVAAKEWKKKKYLIKGNGK